MTIVQKMHIKKGDTVIVISGEDKGSIGRVIALFPDTDRVLVEKGTATLVEGVRALGFEVENP